MPLPFAKLTECDFRFSSEKRSYSNHLSDSSNRKKKIVQWTLQAAGAAHGSPGIRIYEHKHDKCIRKY